LGHASFKHIQHLFALPRDGSTQILRPHNQRVSVCEIPRCEACQYAKQKRRPTSTAVKRSIPERQGGLKDGILEPGQTVSVDLYQSTILGRLPLTKGREPEDEKFAGGTIFYDIASRFIFVKHQANLPAASTLVSKHAFDSYSDELGNKINTYLSDNHPFRFSEFVQDCRNQGQRQQLSGVGAHHQTLVERASRLSLIGPER
jgi:hypothetical protein